MTVPPIGGQHSRDVPAASSPDVLVERSAFANAVFATDITAYSASAPAHTSGQLDDLAAGHYF
ncbi:hypothetical protein PDG61_23910 [Mycolicibacterium sp. BiH015]|uniref:hypothetical protein n=1 Tax=Mycolicibacterium sp. BiH015 TaxID=3018808 RepID=UPI0022E1A181|nr:hypothetical protein [Mycolicibacterium sp. BiH015]MDA2893975.1 hypothetical protein [Mycolicibacterium sp. BiH015]